MVPREVLTISILQPYDLKSVFTKPVSNFDHKLWKFSQFIKLYYQSSNSTVSKNFLVFQNVSHYIPKISKYELVEFLLLTTNF